MNLDDIIFCLIAMAAGVFTACIVLLKYWEVKDR